MAFVAWFSLAPLMPEVKKSLKLSKIQVNNANIAAVRLVYKNPFIICVVNAIIALTIIMCDHPTCRSVCVHSLLRWSSCFQLVSSCMSALDLQADGTVSNIAYKRCTVLFLRCSTVLQWSPAWPLAL
jgi:hypothetical protein